MYIHLVAGIKLLVAITKLVLSEKELWSPKMNSSKMVKFTKKETIPA